MIMDIMLHYNELERDLLNALLSHRSIQSILNCIAAFFENNVILLDSDLHILDSSSVYAFANDNPRSELDRILNDSRSLHDSLFSRSASIRLHHSSPSSAFAFFFPSDHPRSDTLVSVFFDGTKRTAVMLVFNTKNPIYLSDRAIFDYISNLCIPCIITRYSVFAGPRNHIRSLIVDTITHGKIDKLAMKQRLEQIGWSPYDDYILLKIDMPGHIAEKRTVEAGYFPYEDLFEDCIGVKNNSTIVIIVHNASNLLIKQSVPRLEKLLRHNSSLCGVSLLFCNIFNLDSQYELASVARRLSMPENRVVFYRDFMVNHIANELLSKIPIHAICNHSALKVYEYDQKKQTNLLYTLELYLKHNKSLSAAAEELFIHKNTMTYRLNTISKITSIDLDDADEQAHILFSCMLLRNLKSTNNQLVSLDY